MDRDPSRKFEIVECLWRLVAKVAAEARVIPQIEANSDAAGCLPDYSTPGCDRDLGLRDLRDDLQTQKTLLEPTRAKPEAIARNGDTERPGVGVHRTPNSKECIPKSS
jgi:hypothetical protein